MTESLTLQPEFERRQNSPALPPDEAATWLSTQRESCRICGDLEDEGIAIEWHNFESDKESAFDWPRRAPFRGLELCLNLAGHGSLCSPDSRLNFEPLTAFIYAPASRELRAWRKPGERHRFLTIGLSAGFLRDQLGAYEQALHPAVRDFALSESFVSDPIAAIPLTREHQHLISSLLRPQCSQGPCQLRCKGIILQLMAEFLVRPCCGNEASCDRQKCLALDRARRVVAILERDLADPPTLGDIGHEVGCSPYHLSRTFSREMGMTIPRYLRALRMRYAADLLKNGRCNVTEAAMAVGYSSLSHFSQAFCQAMGCCPAMYSSQALDRPAQVCAASRFAVEEQNCAQDRRFDGATNTEIDVLVGNLH